MSAPPPPRRAPARAPGEANSPQEEVDSRPEEANSRSDETPKRRPQHRLQSVTRVVVVVVPYVKGRSGFGQTIASCTSDGNIRESQELGPAWST
eukprot:3042010-Pyramimonas_sp.AAC.1